MKDCRLDYLAAIEALSDRAGILNDIADGDYTGDAMPEDAADAIRREAAIIRGLVHVIEESVGKIDGGVKA